MRPDLAARLRTIVRRETAAPAAPLRELTYVPDPAASGARFHDTAARLGGVNLDAAGSCAVVERSYPLDRSHGRRTIESCLPSAGAPLHLFDPRIPASSNWHRRMIFFDTETTGLSGGAGTLAFLVGCGWFDEHGFTVRQFFLAGPSGERPMLDALQAILADASLLVTFNGRSFDVPLMETRWAFHRHAAATDDVRHFDMLHPARRLWGRRGEVPDSTDGCSLSSLERRVLGFHRIGDVPGFEIPSRYFHFLRTGDPDVIEGVLEHNRYDIVSTAAVMAQALWLVEEGPDACREPGEQAALGRVYEGAGDVDRAVRSYEMAVAAGEAEVKRSALGRLAVLHRREGRHDEAAATWQGILDLVPRSRSSLTTLERRAVEALAVHHEHRARNLSSAHRLARTLDAQATGRLKQEATRRLRRIERKLGSEPADSSDGSGKPEGLPYDNPQS